MARFPRSALACVATLLAAACPASATTLHVTPDGSGDAPTIQAAILAAAEGDTVELAGGVYTEHEILLTSGVTVRSETGEPDGATIDAQGLGPAFLCIDQTVPLRLTGLTITAGQGLPGAENGGGGVHCRASELVIEDCTFTGNTSQFGGGLGIYDCAPLLERCVFTGNSVSSPQWAAGGGLFCRDAAPDLRECSFSSNTAFSVQLPGDGGGVFARSSQLKATDCSFVGNSSGAAGGGLYSYDQDESLLLNCRFEGNTSIAGGGVYLETSLAQAVGCVFVGNTAANGGAIYMSHWSYPTARACTFLDNGAAPNSGGAIDCWHSSPVLEDCVFQNNSASLDGGAFASNGVCQPDLERCRFIGNTAGQNGGALSGYYSTAVDFRECTLVGNAATGSGGGIYYRLSGPLLLDRSIIAFSADGEAVACSESILLALMCTDIHGNAGGDWVGCIADWGGVLRNFSADPRFCNAAAGDVFLRPDSPCLPPNNACRTLVGAQGEGCSGPVSAGRTLESSSWGLIKVKYRDAGSEVVRD